MFTGTLTPSLSGRSKKLRRELPDLEGSSLRVISQASADSARRRSEPSSLLEELGGHDVAGDDRREPPA
jgi:hypothetical protein